MVEEVEEDEEEEDEEPPAPEPVVEEPPALSKPSGKRKKKKKSAAVVETPPPPPEPVAVVKTPPPVPVEAPVPAPEPAKIEPDNDPASAGKNKKKKKNKTASKTEGVGAAPVATTNGSEKTAPQPAPVSPPEYFETPAVVEVWAPVKKNKGAKATAATIAAAPATETTAGDPSQTKTISMSIGQEGPALLIGPGGSTIRNLEVSTGCKFDIQKDGASPSVKITGTADQCALAQATIQGMLDDEAARSARRVTKSITFEGGAVKAVIGKGGATIQDIEQRTGAKLEVSVAEGTCTVTGE